SSQWPRWCKGVALAPTHPLSWGPYIGRGVTSSVGGADRGSNHAVALRRHAADDDDSIARAESLIVSLVCRGQIDRDARSAVEGQRHPFARDPQDRADERVLDGRGPGGGA